MKLNTPICGALLGCCIVITNFSFAQNVGIGTATPVTKLHVEQSSAEATTAALFNLNTSATVGASTGIYNSVSAPNNHEVYGIRTVTSGAGTAYGIFSDVFGASAGQKIGIWGKSAGGASNTAVGGLAMGGSGAVNMGIYGSAHSGALNWAGYFDQGDVFIQNRLNVGASNFNYRLNVVGVDPVLSRFLNQSTASTDYEGLYASCNNIPFFGVGVKGEGGYIGVVGKSELIGAGSRYGTQGVASNGNSNYGLYGSASSGTSGYGVFGTASNSTYSYGVYGTTTSGTVQYAGYFSGNVFTTGSYLPSDRKLKTGIEDISNGLDIIMKLRPTFYQYRTDEYKQMNLPKNFRYGLIADEVMAVLPNLVVTTVQPASFENNDEKSGKKLSDEVEFNAVNYMELIPLLISAVKEQNIMIQELKKELEILKNK